MRAVTYNEDGSVQLREVAEPALEDDGDAIVRVTAAGICGSDLHLIHGRVPGLADGQVIGHEAVGVVEQVGSGVSKFAVGDRVVVSFSIVCGECWFCARQEFSQCEDARALGYGMFLGDLAGAQAEKVRVPIADRNLLKIVDGVSDEQAVFVGDILTTGVYICSRSGVARGSSVAVIGAGPVGLMSIMAAIGMGADPVYAIDQDASRLAIAEKLGAIAVNSAERNPVVAIQKETEERGTDVVLECVGIEATFAMALDLVRPNGSAGVIGVHTDLETSFPLGEAWRRGISVVMGGTCNVQAHWEEAMAMIADGRIDPASIITDRVGLDGAVEAYARFEAREALKVIISP